MKELNIHDVEQVSGAGILTPIYTAAGSLVGGVLGTQMTAGAGALAIGSVVLPPYLFIAACVVLGGGVGYTMSPKSSSGASSPFYPYF